MTVKRVLGISLLLVAGMGLTTQAQKKAAAPEQQQQMDKFDDAHRGLFNAKSDKAKEAGRFTADVTKSLPGAAVPAGKIPRKNFVDEILFSRMERDKIPSAPLATDEEFVRRVYLDATGILPTADQTRAFLADRDPQKRDKLIDQLVGSDGFAENFAWFYGDLFRLVNRSGYGKNAFHFWLKEWLRSDRPYNEMVSDLITPSTKSHSTIPSLAFLGRTGGNNVKSRIPTDPDNYDIMNRLDTIDEYTVDLTRIFLGINTECISCHDGAGHTDTVNLFLTSKTRDEFFKQSAFFGKTRLVTFWDDRIKNVADFDYVLDDEARGYNTDNDAPFFTTSESRFPRSGGTYEPQFILTGEKPKPGENARVALARMLTSHPQFSRATANLIWGKLMTVGFVEPYDGFDLLRIDPKTKLPKGWNVQPNNPELLEAIGKDFEKSGFSIHHMIRTIMKSSAYQLSSHFPGEWKDSYADYYNRRLVRTMTGPEVFDAIALATGRPGAFTVAGASREYVKQLPSPDDVGGRRSKEGGEIASLLQSFYQSNRYTPAPTGNKPSTLQAMLLMNSRIVNDRVSAEKGGTVQKLVESTKTNDQIVDELFLASLSRMPNKAEREVALAEISKDRKGGAENVQWALLNSIEFVLNH